MPAAVAPLILAGGSLGSAWLGGRAANSAAKTAAQMSPEERALFNQTQQQSREMYGTAMPAIKSSISYYQNLLNGGQAARMAAASPEAQDVASAYQGADEAVRRNLQGGERNQALAENARQRAGQIARLVTGRRGEGAAGIAGIAQPLVTGSTGINANLLGNAMYNRMQANQYGAQVGAGTAGSMGTLLAILAGSGVFNRSGGRPGGGGPGPAGPPPPGTGGQY